MILNIHGFGSDGENSKFRWLAANMCPPHDITSPTLDYRRGSAYDGLDRLDAIVSRAIDEHDGRADDIYIIGNSLGGFFARALHARHPGVKAILTNPCLMPFLSLEKEISPKQLYDCFTIFRETFREAASGPETRYEPYEADGSNLFVIYGTADELIPHCDLTLPLLPRRGTSIFKVDGGTHRMPIEGAFEAALRAIIKPPVSKEGGLITLDV